MTPPTETTKAEKTPYEEATEAAEAIAAIIREYRNVYSTEDSLQARIAAMLLAAEVDHDREHNLSKADRIDLMAGAVGIEVKIAGDAGSVRRQLTRYAKHDEVKALVLVTTRARHRALPPNMNGKPLVIVWLSGNFITAAGR